jgi:import inner membrane translocase subunit TIM17
MSTPDYEGSPCPEAILHNIGLGFGLGLAGGSPWHFCKGMRNSPKGERFMGAAQAVRLNAPRLAGGWAVWTGLYSTFYCSLEYLRQKDDAGNSIAAAAATAGFLKLRAGARLAAKSAISCGMFFALYEGILIMSERITQLPPAEEKPQSAGAPAGIALPSEAHPKSAEAGGPASE